MRTAQLIITIDVDDPQGFFAEEFGEEHHLSDIEEALARIFHPGSNPKVTLDDARDSTNDVVDYDLPLLNDPER